MLIRDLKRLLFLKPSMLSQEDFDNMEVTLITNNGIEQISDIEDVGVQMVEAGVYYAFMFCLPAESAEMPEEEIKFGDATGELLFLAQKHLDENS